MKNLVNACKAKVMGNRGEETVNVVLILIAGLILVAAFIGTVVATAKGAIDNSGNFISKQTECAVKGQFWNVQANNGKGACQ